MTKRYFVETPITGDLASLAGSEAQHLTKVMRLKVGDEVTLFDGSGFEFVAIIDALDRVNVRLSIKSKTMIDRELPVQLTLAVALPKGDRQKWLVEKAVELGVSRLVPLQTERGVAQPVDKALSRLGRVVIEASKQCGRNRLMRIDQPQSLAQLADGLHSLSDFTGLVAHPGAESIPISEVRFTNANVCVAVGPEGGFSEPEIQKVSQWRCVQLGPRILRVETAAIAMASFVALNQASATMTPC